MTTVITLQDTDPGIQVQVLNDDGSEFTSKDYNSTNYLVRIDNQAQVYKILKITNQQGSSLTTSSDPAAQFSIVGTIFFDNRVIEYIVESINGSPKVKT